MTFGKNYSSDESTNNGDNNHCDSSKSSGCQSISKVREKFRKKRENENRILERFHYGASSRSLSSASNVPVVAQQQDQEPQSAEKEILHRHNDPEQIKKNKKSSTATSPKKKNLRCGYLDLPKIDVLSDLKRVPSKSILKLKPSCITPPQLSHCEHQSSRDDDGGGEETSMDGQTPSHSSHDRPSTEQESDFDQKKKNDDKTKKHVSFGTIHIRYHLQTLGDHPAVTFGPPLSLDWKYKDEMSSFPINDLVETEVRKSTTSSSPSSRGEGKQLLISSMVRRNILLDEYGFSESDIDHAIQQIDIIKTHRSQSYSDPSATPSSPELSSSYSPPSSLLLNSTTSSSSIYQHYPTTATHYIAITT